MAKRSRFIRIPDSPESTFSESYLNPDTVVFLGKVKVSDGTDLPVLFLTSGMKVVVSDATFYKILDLFDEIKDTQVPDAFTSAWPVHVEEDDEEEPPLDNGDKVPV